MDDIHDSEPDDFDALLGRSLPAGSPELRQSLLTATTRVLRRRRRMRQLGLIAALAACYAAGLLTMRLAMASQVEKPALVEATPEPGKRVTSNEEQRMENEERGTDAEERLPVSPAHNERETALAMEWQAVDSLGKRPDLYREAGDRYFQEGDLESAIRCYRGSLDTASEKDLTVSPEDNWLLMSLKEAKKKEKRHAHSG